MGVVLLLNPGRNGANIPQFPHSALFALATCGVCLMFYSAAGLIQPTRMEAVLLPEPATTRDRMRFLLALLLGLACVYYAAQGTGLVGRSL